jgi:hypothetical protein
MEIGVYQFTTEVQSNMVFLANHVSPSPIKGFALMEPWCRDPMKHEVDRAVKITNDKKLNVVSLSMVNRTGLFQPALHPPFPGNVPNNTVKAWLKG